MKRRLLLLLLLLAISILLVLYFAKYLNENQGVITAIGLFLIIPTTIVSDRLLIWSKKEQDEYDLKKMLLSEFWLNLNYVSQIENSHVANLSDKDLHIPHYPPRTHILGKVIDFNLLGTLKEFDRNAIVEIYEQLESLKHEYYLWRDLVQKTGINSDKHLYGIMSSTMVSYIDPVMRNMLKIWINLVISYGGECEIPQIKNINRILKEKISNGKWIITAYKSSFYKNNDDDSFNTILCWINDWPESKKEVFEIKNIAAMYKSWTSN